MFASINEANRRCVDCYELSNSKVNKVEDKVVDRTLELGSTDLVREEAFEFSLEQRRKGQ